jgi:hypothetical protein
VPAAAEYEISAYRFLKHANSADAGYAALLAYAEQDSAPAPRAARRSARPEARRTTGLRFAALTPPMHALHRC